MSQLSRKYNKLVEIWKVSEVPDGFGGTTTEEAPDKTVWMEVTSNISRRAIEQGVTDGLNTLKFTMRYREGISLEDTFFNYRGKKYVLQSVDNVDQMNQELICYGTNK